MMAMEQLSALGPADSAGTRRFSHTSDFLMTHGSGAAGSFAMPAVYMTPAAFSFSGGGAETPHAAAPSRG